MINIFRRFVIFLPAAILSFVATILRCIASTTSMDYSTGYYDNSTLINVADIATTIAVLLLLGALFIKVEKNSLHHSNRNIFGKITACALAIAMLLASYSLYLYLVSNLPIFSFEALLSHRSFVVAVIAAVLAVLGAAYAIISAFVSAERKLLHALFGIAAALFFGIYAGFTFFRFGNSINQPQKIITEMAMLAMAIFLLEETRIPLGRERRNNYFVFGVIAVILSSYAAFPAIVVLIARERMIAFSFAEALIMLTALCFTVCKLILAAISVTNAPTNKCAEKDVILTDEALQLSIADLYVQEESEISHEENSGN